MRGCKKYEVQQRTSFFFIKNILYSFLYNIIHICNLSESCPLSATSFQPLYTSTNAYPPMLINFLLITPKLNYCSLYTQKKELHRTTSYLIDLTVLPPPLSAYSMNLKGEQNLISMSHSGLIYQYSAYYQSLTSYVFPYCFPLQKEASLTKIEGRINLWV